MNRKTSSLVAVREILEQRVIEQAGSPVLNLLELVRRWPDVVGVEIAAKTTPLRIHAGTLTLQAVNATWSNELQLMAPELLSKIRAQCPQLPLKRLRFIA